MLFDYVRIRFPTTDVKHILEDVLRLKLSYFIHEDYGFYSYNEKDYTEEELQKVAELDKVITEAEKDALIDTIIVKTQGFVNGIVQWATGCI